MTSLAALVREEIDRWGVSVVEQAVFGTVEPAEIEAMVDDLCGSALGSTVSGGLFYGTSVGCVAGVELDDGRRVVMKAYQPPLGSGLPGCRGRGPGGGRRRRLPVPDAAGRARRHWDRARAGQH